MLEDLKEIKPYSTGNVHPGFMGWVHGAGTSIGMVAEMLAAGLNANCGGRNHIGIDVERQVTLWMAEALGFPETSAGLFVTGTSIANFLGLLIARNHRLGDDVRKTGLSAADRLVAYASQATHGCISQALELASLGSDALRLIPCDASGAMRVSALERHWEADRAAGLVPLLVVGAAGSVDIGAIDPLVQLADFCAERQLWFHVDAAFGAMLAFSPKLCDRIRGIERADSVALDFHKWTHVPYDAGFLLTRDAEAQRRAFASERGYPIGPRRGRRLALRPRPGSLARLSRSEDLVHADDVGDRSSGSGDREKLRARRTSRLAYPALAGLPTERSRFAQYRLLQLSQGADRDAQNRSIVEALHNSGRWVPSITMLDGVATIRCAIVNHRTSAADIDAFFGDVERIAGALTPDSSE